MKRGRFRALSATTLIGFVAAVGLAACGGSSGASGGSTSGHSSGKSYSISYSVPLGTTDPQTQAADQFAKQVEKLSKGQITVHVFPNNSLGTQDQIDQGVSSGNTQMVATAPGDISNLYPAIKVVTLPFLFDSRSQVFAALDGKLGSMLSAGMEQKAGIKILAWGDLGWSQLLSKTRVLNQLSQISGLKVRTAGTPTEDAAFSAVGAIPVTIDFGELYTALETGTVSATDLPVQVIESGKYDEVAKFLTNLDFYYQPSVVFINAKFYNSLPASLQKDVTEAAQTAADTERANQVKELSSELTTLKSNGVQIGSLSASARSQWAALSKTKVIAPFAKQYGSALIDAAEHP